jgi:hypothetical protein
MGSTILQLGTLTPWHEHARSRRHDRAVNERVCDDADVAQVGDDEAKLILARGSGAHVIASAPQRQYDDVIVDYRVEVTAQGLSANTIVTSLGGDDLAGFLDGLAEHFTGWPGNSLLAQPRRSAPRRSRVGQSRPRDAADQTSTEGLRPAMGPRNHNCRGSRGRDADAREGGRKLLRHVAPVVRDRTPSSE